ncbi:chromosome segregation protein SMC [Fructilactobacillus sp. Tb1]|uniref:chromosome segregation protein SMC n=1 Tax=Fructilactobacillus sp. Tb1 TaxID=3422304 RepID=UPI003D2D4546
MKLKSIQIAGFKSFANKTNIDFQNGFTGIVGPNGSGKSNVIEAVRWALGEQSAKSLRGKKMKDVIFSGSKDRHPLNRAEVSLIFDNTSHFLDSEYSEVKITRTYYRNGDSIYSINDQECLLRDIHNLFMDTGLGEGSLSIISQGNVDDILDDDVQKRRAIIETAAGVYRYKKQKNESEKKLEDTQANLDRISDIIHEIEKQMNPLKEQSEIASLYLSKNKHLDELNFNKFSIDLKNGNAEAHEIQTSLTEAHQEQNRLTNEFNGLNTQKENTNKNINELDIAKERLQTKLLSENKLLENLSSEKKLSEQKEKFNSQKQTELQTQLEDLDSQKHDLTKQLEQESLKQTELSNELDELRAQIKNSKAIQLEKNVQDTETKIEQGRSNYVGLMQSISDARNDLRLTEKLSQQSDNNSKAIFQELNQNQKHLNELDSKRSVTKKNVAELKLQKQTIDEKLATIDETVKDSETKADTMRNRWLDAMRIFQEAKTERDSLSSMLENHNNLYRGTRNLLKQKNNLTGIIGTVGDYIDVDSKYIQAIETALGGAIQQVIVANVTDARQAIKYLNQNKLGRVTFLPVNGINDRFVPENLLKNARKTPGFVAVAADLVKMKPEYQRVNQHLLGGTIIADSLKAATEISNTVNHRVKVVSLNGDVVNAGGSITGGKNQHQNEGLLSQKEKLITLTDQVKRMQEKLDFGEQNVKTAQNQLKQEQENKRIIYQDASDLTAKITLAQNNLELQTNERTKVDRAIKALKLKLGSSEDSEYNNPESLKQQIQKLQTEIDHNQNQNKSLASQLEDLKREYSSELNAVNNLKQQVGIIKERFNNVKQHCLDLKQQLNANEKQQVETKKSMDDVVQELAQINKIKQVDTVEIEAEISKIENDFSKTKNDFETQRANLQQLDDKISKNQQQMIQNSDKLHHFESQLAVVKQNLDRNQAKLVELENNNRKYETLSLDLTELNTEINNIKLEISNLGPVNIGAIDTYKEIKERYEFMQHQMDDLVEAKNQLLTIMNKMDETVKVRFENAYNQISKSFSKVFRNIFGGGEAKLELSDPHHLLTTGIDILVKPPGKRYRSINLLSGGEKALTALALLFAIIEVKPVPFVILDEAESALDPANVDRFARYIESLKQETQFIVVTHRKETMIYADNLFGITMQDSGISKLVSVDLSSNKNRR